MFSQPPVRRLPKTPVESKLEAKMVMYYTEVDFRVPRQGKVSKYEQNTEEYGPEKTPCWDTFQTVLILNYGL